jgi:hypothetical protein
MGGIPGSAPPLDPFSTETEHVSGGGSAARLYAKTRGLSGLTSVMVEERQHPLWLRAGTEDVDSAIAMLDPAANGLKCAHEPRRIVEIGAGAGYRTVAMAAAYPGAEILAAEPNPSLQRTGLLNTLPYDNITYVNALIISEEGYHGYFDRTGAQGRPSLVAHQAGHIKSQKFTQFLNYYRFADADTLIITADAASLRILHEPLPPALQLIAVETGGAGLPPETARCYPLAEFISVISGAYVLLYRRGHKRLAPTPRPIAVLAPDGAARRWRLENVIEGGFFHLPGGGVRLQPNAPGMATARLALSVELREHDLLQASFRVAGEPAVPVRFTVKVYTADGRVLASGSEIIRDMRPRPLVLTLLPYQGPCEVVFSTEIAGPGTSAAGAWAEIMSATLI